ncbi:MAG: hypothetical protein MZV70_37050 [Desulfobacterales bacterium]|nr:hypothetical protein [Desulfobacterales bacterium]
MPLELPHRSWPGSMATSSSDLKTPPGRYGAEAHGLPGPPECLVRRAQKLDTREIERLRVRQVYQEPLRGGVRIHQQILEQGSVLDSELALSRENPVAR